MDRVPLEVLEQILEHVVEADSDAFARQHTRLCSLNRVCKRFAKAVDIIDRDLIAVKTELVEPLTPEGQQRLFGLARRFHLRPDPSRRLELRVLSKDGDVCDSDRLCGIVAVADNIDNVECLVMTLHGTMTPDMATHLTSALRYLLARYPLLDYLYLRVADPAALLDPWQMAWALGSSHALSTLTLDCQFDWSKPVPAGLLEHAVAPRALNTVRLWATPGANAEDRDRTARFLRWLLPPFGPQHKYYDEGEEGYDVALERWGAPRDLMLEDIQVVTTSFEAFTVGVLDLFDPALHPQHLEDGLVRPRLRFFAAAHSYLESSEAIVAWLSRMPNIVEVHFGTLQVRCNPQDQASHSIDGRANLLSALASPAIPKSLACLCLGQGEEGTEYRWGEDEVVRMETACRARGIELIWTSP